MKRWLKAMLAGAVVLAPVAGFAGIDNTHHDMTTLISTKGQKCAYCHSLTNVAVANGYGSVGGFCVSVCHTGSGEVFTASAQVLPQGPGVFVGNRGAFVNTTGASSPLVLSLTGAGHAALQTAIVTAGDLQANIGNTGWPHSNEASIQCTTCHAVHDATNPPFLNAPLSTGNASTAFCVKCHKGDAAAFTGTTGRLGNGAHPTEVPYYTVANSALRTFYITNAGAPLNMFVVANVVGNFNAFTSHWNTGGHLINNGTNMPVAIGTAGANVGCYSCHSVHTDVTTPSSLATSLITANNFRDFCGACHGNGAYTFGAGGTQNNPGVTNQYHPVNNEAPTSYFYTIGALANSLIANYGTIPAQYRPVGNNNSPYCITCHAMHGSKPNRHALRNIANGVTNFCMECHGTIAGHHPIGNSAYNVVALGNFAAATGWGASLADGLQCSDCHGATSAHNW